MTMTESPTPLSQARRWAAAARSFHEQQLAKPRKVMRFGKTRMVFTKGEAFCTAGAVYVSGSVSSAGAPDWVTMALLVGGILGGRYFYPVPDTSIASKKGPADVAPLAPGQLDMLTPDEIRAYEYNMVFKHGLKGLEPLGTAQALARQREAAMAAEHAAALAPGSLGGLSVVDSRAFAAAAMQHDAIKSRWLAYEVDPQLQFDYPAMSDASVPATAAMIRAMRAADQARSTRRTAEYQSAVAAFGEALTAAEVAAGVRRH